MKRSQFKKQHIFICSGKDCKKKGCEELKTDLKKTLKLTNDKSIRLIKTKCMDYCKLGPNISLQGKLFHECTPLDIPEIIAELDRPKK